MPVRLVVDVTDLKMGASMAVKDINLPKGVKVVSDSEAVIARVRNIQ